jgi:hypothetical protein
MNMDIKINLGNIAIPIKLVVIEFLSDVTTNMGLVHLHKTTICPKTDRILLSSQIELILLEQLPGENTRWIPLPLQPS